MLAIRLQRTGRSGHAQFRIIVQDSRFSPNKGRVVAYLGSYNPHTKHTALDSQAASRYLDNGAQPSDRAARLLQAEGIKLPDWIKLTPSKQRDTRKPEKRRSTAPAQPETGAPSAEVAAEQPAPAADEGSAETAAEEVTAAADEPAA